ALCDKGELAEAIREYREAIRLDPNYFPAHTNLGNALRATGQLDESVREFRASIALNPQYAEAHCGLGLTYRLQGKLAEALAELREGHQLGSRQKGWRYPSDAWLREAEGLDRLNRKLPALLEGKENPADDAERLGLAQLCQEPFQKRFAASARFYAEAFAHEAKLADDLQKGYRYNAACAAALPAPAPDAAA